LETCKALKKHFSKVSLCFLNIWNSENGWFFNIYLVRKHLNLWYSYPKTNWRNCLNQLIRNLHSSSSWLRHYRYETYYWFWNLETILPSRPFFHTCSLHLTNRVSCLCIRGKEKIKLTVVLCKMTAKNIFYHLALKKHCKGEFLFFIDSYYYSNNFQLCPFLPQFSLNSLMSKEDFFIMILTKSDLCTIQQYFSHHH
jgi:hypothetical protein